MQESSSREGLLAIYSNAAPMTLRNHAIALAFLTIYLGIALSPRLSRDSCWTDASATRLLDLALLARLPVPFAW
eukprot:4055851-Pyramimonas_sp.AAC.1